MKRIKCTTVTEALVVAAEHAEEMDNVVILYRGVNGSPDGIFCDEKISVQHANYLLDQCKLMLFNHVRRGNDGD